jgi:ATP-dependent helicase Lhr and Lhr-like helicase
VISDNFQLRLEGGNATLKAIYKIFDRMREPEFWTDRSVWGPITAGLPEYRLSKFQRALPPAFSEEMLIGYLLDVEGTRRLVNSGRDAVGVLL